MENKAKKYISVSELAKMLGISRVAVLKKITKGQLPAQKVGRAYVISIEDISDIVDIEDPEAKKAEISEAVKRVVDEYGETLKLLGKE